jgi:predicted dinucleotide-binding enzyme
VAGVATPRALVQPARTLRIGIIGSGNMGGVIGTLWARAGHEILFSSRSPATLERLTADGGPGTRAGYPNEAAAFGPVVFLALPYRAIPQIGRDFGALMKGKVVIDCSNPSVRDDGEMARAALESGSGVATAGYIPGAHVVRAFGTISYRVAQQSAHRAGDKIGVPIAADDADALRTASRLVSDAGFDPVVVGGLRRSKEFDIGAPGSGLDTTAAELRKIFKVQPAGPRGDRHCGRRNSPTYTALPRMCPCIAA